MEVTVLVHWETSSFKHISFSLQIPSVPAAAEPVNSSSSKTSQSSPGASWLPETSAASGGQEVRRAGRKVRAKVLPLPCRRGTFILPVSLRPATLYVITQVNTSSESRVQFQLLLFFNVFFFSCKLNPCFITSAWKLTWKPAVNQSPMFCFFNAGNIFKYQRCGGRGRIRVREGWWWGL